MAQNDIASGFPSRPVSSGAAARVAVIIPCHDDGAYVPEAAASVAGEPDVEVLIIDDGSTDESTITSLEEIAGHGIAVIHQANAGLSAARMAGVRATRAPYIFNLDADDLAAPGALGAMAALLDAHPEADVCFGDYLEFGDTELTRAVPPAIDPFRLAYTNEYPVTAMFRRQALERVGGWRHLGAGYEDWNLWLALAEAGCTGLHAGSGRHTFHKRVQRGRMLSVAKAEHQTLYGALRRAHPGIYGQIARHRRASRLSRPRKLLYPIVYGGRPRFSFERPVKAWLDRKGIWTMRG
jgi:glycosyltransferase involved in cell wall biosynthesis